MRKAEGKYSLRIKANYNVLNFIKVKDKNYYYRNPVRGYKINGTNFIIWKNKKNEKCSICDMESGIKIYSYVGSVSHFLKKIDMQELLDRWNKYYDEHLDLVNHFSETLNDLPIREELVEELKNEKADKRNSYDCY